MPERFIMLMRHAQTQLNAGKRLIGRCDVELSEEGNALCHQIGAELKRYGIDRVFSSGLKRATRTAHILCSYINKEVNIVEALGEIALGEWDGRFVDDIKHEYPEAYADRGRDIVCFRPPGGENLIDLSARVLPAFKDILKHKGNILIVAHTSVNRVILADVTGAPLRSVMDIPQHYGASHMLAQSGGQLFVKALNCKM